jgi:hypothetical protein
MEVFKGAFEDLKINQDLDNKAHGPHYDIVQKINIDGLKGADQIRISPTGDVMGGTTNFPSGITSPGPTKIHW